MEGIQISSFLYAELSTVFCCHHSKLQPANFNMDHIITGSLSGAGREGLTIYLTAVSEPMTHPWHNRFQNFSDQKYSVKELASSVAAA